MTIGYTQSLLLTSFVFSVKLEHDESFVDFGIFGFSCIRFFQVYHFCLGRKSSYELWSCIVFSLRAHQYHHYVIVYNEDLRGD